MTEAAWNWDWLPVDDVGYRLPDDVLALDDPQLRNWVAAFERRRYGGWRNWGNLWRETLGLDATTGKHVLDYGCGFGIEALQFARTGNRLTLADLTEKGLAAASRVLAVHGYDCDLVGVDALPEADIFYANGVLHHFPEGMDVLAAAPCKEARLMVYSDRAWDAFGRDPASFWKRMDGIGGYADHYSPDDLARVPGWTLRASNYITKQGWYMTAVLCRD